MDRAGLAPVQSPTGRNLNGVWSSAENDAWAVGEQGVVLRSDGARWNTVESGSGASLNAIWRSEPNEVWIVGDEGTVLR